MKRRKRSKKVRLNRSLGGDIGVFLFLTLVGIFMIIPFVFAISNSLKPLHELFIFPPPLFPRDPTLDNYTDLFQLAGNLWVPFSRYLFNSIFVAVVVTVANVIVCSSAGFVLAKGNFPGKKTLNQIIVTSLLFTSTVTAVMQYMVMAKMGMINTYWALILPYIATPMNLFLMRQFMGQLPDSMIEAAKMDGASTFRTCWQVAIPNVKPAVMTLLIFAFQAAWNITGTQFVYQEQLKTLPTVISQITAAGIARTGVGAAAAVVMMTPPLILFIITQSNVLETMAHSGIKD